MLKAKSFKDIKEKDLILTVDLAYNESVEIVKCVDNHGIWTGSFIDRGYGEDEIFESEEQLFTEYKEIIILNR